MKHLTRAWAGVVLWAWFASAQMVPDRYVVELTQPPLGAAVRTKGKDALSDPHRAILTEQARVRRAIESQRGRVTASVDSLMNALLVTLPGQSPSVLASIPGVKKVYPVQEVHLHLDRALGLHRVPTAWTLLGGKDQAGAGLKIAILDTGVSPDHPGFQDSSLPFPPGFPRGSSEQNLKLTNHKIIVARSYEDIYRLTEPDDANDRVGHGTAVAMCAAGVTNTGPRATITGVAPKAWIGSYKVFPLKRNASSDAILKALDDALSDGMDVINMSFGSLFQDTGPDALYSVALDRLKNFGVMVVVSVGNHGSALNSLTNISTLPSVISVGAMRNDRVFSDSLTVAGETYLAQAGTGPRPLSAVKGAVFDVEAIDPTGLLCARAAEIGRASCRERV